MADFRDHGNTAYMLKDGEWRDVSTYFPAGANHTSYMIMPSIVHSVMSPMPVDREPLVVGKVRLNIRSIRYTVMKLLFGVMPSGVGSWVSRMA